MRLLRIKFDNLSIVGEHQIVDFGLSRELSALLLVGMYFYAHYFFASTTAHITAMLAAFYSAGLALGAPPMFLALMMSLTHYTTPSPIIFGSGYVSMENWWVAGLVMSLVTLAVWAIVGGIWWNLPGYW